MRPLRGAAWYLGFGHFGSVDSRIGATFTGFLPTPVPLFLH